MSGANAWCGRAEGKWSAQEHVGHLLELEPLWMARVDDYVAGRDELSVADLSNRSTFEARYNDRAIGEDSGGFSAARASSWLSDSRESTPRYSGERFCIRG